jgi:hypothetical protein
LEVVEMVFINVVVALVVIALIAWLMNTRVSLPPNAKRIVNVVLGLIVVGILLSLVNSYVPMAGSIRALLNIVVVVACCVWVLQSFGVWNQIVSRWHDLTSHRTPSERV